MTAGFEVRPVGWIKSPLSGVFSTRPNVRVIHPPTENHR